MQRLPKAFSPGHSAVNSGMVYIPPITISAEELASHDSECSDDNASSVNAKTIDHNHSQEKDASHDFGILPSSQTSKLKWNVGRAPWYDDSGRPNAPLFIGVTGGSASGKTSVCSAIVRKLALPWVGLLSMDRFYRSLTKEEKADAHDGNYNFDHPDAFDTDQLFKTLTEMKTGRAVDVPIYDFSTHSRLEATDRMYGVDIVLVEGILLFYDKKVRDLLDLKIYVDTDSDLRLARRICRDIRERGRTVDSVLEQYERTVKPSFEEYLLPTKRFADLIIPWNDTNHVAVDLLTQHIMGRLEKRGVRDFTTPTLRPRLLHPNEMPRNITVMLRSDALKALHSSIRDQSATAESFTFNILRLARLVTTEAVSLLDFTPRCVNTPTDVKFGGLELASSIVAVSVIRTGEIFESAIRDLLPDVPVGKIVIQQNESRKEELGPRLYYAKLPTMISESNCNVLLFDGVLATGGAVSMAIHVLLDHGVPLERIVFCCFVAAPEGLQKLTRIFPGLRIITSWVDDGLDTKKYITPGVGYLGDRFFATGSGNGTQ